MDQDRTCPGKNADDDDGGGGGGTGATAAARSRSVFGLRAVLRWLFLLKRR